MQWLLLVLLCTADSAAAWDIGNMIMGESREATFLSINSTLAFSYTALDSLLDHVETLLDASLARVDLVVDGAATRTADVLADTGAQLDRVVDRLEHLLDERLLDTVDELLARADATAERSTAAVERLAAGLEAAADRRLDQLAALLVGVERAVYRALQAALLLAAGVAGVCLAYKSARHGQRPQLALAIAVVAAVYWRLQDMATALQFVNL